jgi:hypothetical protein
MFLQKLVCIGWILLLKVCPETLVVWEILQIAICSNDKETSWIELRVPVNLFKIVFRKKKPAVSIGRAHRRTCRYHECSMQQKYHMSYTENQELLHHSFHPNLLVSMMQEWSVSLILNPTSHFSILFSHKALNIVEFLNIGLTCKTIRSKQKCNTWTKPNSMDRKHIICLLYWYEESALQISREKKQTLLLLVDQQWFLTNPNVYTLW